MKTITDTIQDAADLVMASALEHGTYDSRQVFLAQAGSAEIDDCDWLVMLGHLLAYQANSQAAAMPPQATAAANPGEAR